MRGGRRGVPDILPNGHGILACSFAGCNEPPVAKQVNDTDSKRTAAATPANKPSADKASADKSHRPVRIADPHLENVYQVHPKVISGGEPHGEKALNRSPRLGVKTVISVDGAKPDVDLAKKHGMRVRAFAAQLRRRARGSRQRTGQSGPRPGRPGLHPLPSRQAPQPRAAAVACVGAGLIGPADALAILTTAGTSTNYRGLYQSAEQARPFDDALLDALEVEFRESVEVPPLADAMVALERTHDHVKQIAAAGWRPVPENPDLDPPTRCCYCASTTPSYCGPTMCSDTTAEFQEANAQWRRGRKVARECACNESNEQRYPAEKTDCTSRPTRS